MNAIARIAAITAVLITAPTWAQTLRIGGVDLRVVPDAHVVKADSTDAPVLGKVGTYAIVRGASVPAAKGLAASDAQTDHLGVAFNPGTGRYGLISRELTFRLKPGTSLPSEYAAMGCKALIEKSNSSSAMWTPSTSFSPPKPRCAQDRMWSGWRCMSSPTSGFRSKPVGHLPRPRSPLRGGRQKKPGSA